MAIAASPPGVTLSLVEPARLVVALRDRRLPETMAPEGLQQVQTMPDSRPVEPRRPDAALIDDWHVVGFSSDVADDKVAATRLLGEELVIWRHAGQVHVWK